jgi:hypothetical protein
MQQSKAIPQGSVSCGQALAAIGILVFLAITVPLLGVLMIPVVALIPVVRALKARAPRVGAGTGSRPARPRRAARPLAVSTASGR